MQAKKKKKSYLCICTNVLANKTIYRTINSTIYTTAQMIFVVTMGISINNLGNSCVQDLVEK